MTKAHVLLLDMKEKLTNELRRVNEALEEIRPSKTKEPYVIWRDENIALDEQYDNFCRPLPEPFAILWMHDSNGAVIGWKITPK